MGGESQSTRGFVDVSTSSPALTFHELTRKSGRSGSTFLIKFSEGFTTASDATEMTCSTWFSAQRMLAFGK